MRAPDAFFRHIGAYRVKTSGMYRIPEVVAVLNRMGIEHGLIAPEIAEAHGVLPEDIELPEPELPPPLPIDVGETAKEEALALLRGTPPSTASPEMPVEDTQPAPPTDAD